MLNDAHGVLLEVEGEPTAVDRFLARLPSEAPPLAVVEQVRVRGADPRPATGALRDPRERRRRAPGRAGDAGHRDLRGLPARAVRPGRPPLPLPVHQLHELRAAVHDRARRALRPPADDDGVVHDVPAMPGRVRGPRRPALPRPAERVPGVRAVAPAARWRRASRSPGTRSRRSRDRRCSRGAIVAIKGIGGYHLACRADDERAVAALRARKHREDKPFALMAPSVSAAESLVSLDARRSRSADRPRAPDRARPASPRCAGRRVGRARGARARRDAPLLAAPPPAARRRRRAARDDERQRVRRADRLPRRGRARAPRRDRRPVPRPRPADPDAHRRLGRARGRFATASRSCAARAATSRLRSRLARRRHAAPAARVRRRAQEHVLPGHGTRAWVSHHIGDLENYETLRSFTEGIEHFGALFAVEPEVVAHDLHPEYLSTKYALERDGVELIGVQHHHAHLAACLAEHGEPGPAVGAIFDGTGYGLDGTVWGGELLLGDARSFRRVGSLLPVALPGGARAITQPWRMACAWLSAAFDDASPTCPPRSPAASTPAPGRRCTGWPPPAPPRRRRPAWAACSTRSPRSAGSAPRSTTRARRRSSSRRRATRASAGSYPIALTGAPLVIDPRETIRAVAADVRAGDRPRRDRPPLPPHDRARHRGRLRDARRGPRHRGRRAVRRRVPEPPAARVGVDRAQRRRAARARARAAAGQRRRDLLRPGRGGGGVS